MTLLTKVLGVSLVLLVVVCIGMAGAQAKGTIKIVTSWPMQGAMIPEGTAMKQAVDLAVQHTGGGRGRFQNEGGERDHGLPTNRGWGCDGAAVNAHKTVGET